MSKLSRLGNALYEGDVSIDFVSPRRRRIWYSISLLIVLVAVLGLYFKGLNLGIEFEGGSEYRVSLPADQVNQDTADRLRETVGSLGIKDAEQPVVTTSGREVLEGRDDWIRIRGIDRWLGGVHLQGPEAAWRWDGEAGRLVRT